MTSSRSARGINLANEIDQDQGQSGIRKQLQREKELLKQAMNPRNNNDFVGNDSPTNQQYVRDRNLERDTPFPINIDDLQSLSANYLQNASACNISQSKRKVFYNII